MVVTLTEVLISERTTSSLVRCYCLKCSVFIQHTRMITDGCASNTLYYSLTISFKRTKLHSVTQANKHETTLSHTSWQTHSRVVRLSTPICTTLPNTDLPLFALLWLVVPEDGFVLRVVAVNKGFIHFISPKALPDAAAGREVRYTVQSVPQGLRTKATIRNEHCPTGSDGSTIKFSPLPKGSFLFLQ